MLRCKNETVEGVCGDIAVKVNGSLVYMKGARLCAGCAGEAIENGDRVETAIGNAIRIREGELDEEGQRHGL